MTGEQIRAARVMLGMTAQEVADAAGVSVPTMQRMDSSKGAVPGRYETVQKVRRALEEKGIQFLDSGEVAVGPGVVLRTRSSEGQ